MRNEFQTTKGKCTARMCAPGAHCERSMAYLLFRLGCTPHTANVVQFHGPRRSQAIWPANTDKLEPDMLTLLARPDPQASMKHTRSLQLARCIKHNKVAIRTLQR